MAEYDVLEKLEAWLDEHDWEIDSPEFGEWLKVEGIDKDSLSIHVCKREDIRG